MINAIQKAIDKLYQIKEVNLPLEKTPANFTGDYTVVVFPLLRHSKKAPEETAKEIGKQLLLDCELVEKYETIKGFLNLTINNDALYKTIAAQRLSPLSTGTSKDTYLVEYSSPNTNKPLHLGHIRNNLLGHSISRILTECGHQVKTIQVINDRGIHICKSMLAWKLFGDNQTPQSSGIKGDHFVGKFYVEYEKQYQKEIAHLINKGLSKEQAAEQSTLNQQVQKMLRDWEKQDPDVIQLWKTMNQWVYDGFEKTYKRLGVSFNKNYYESKTYILGKKVIKEGLDKGIFYRKSDGSVWVDLTDDGLDEKILLRSDGTAVYITQDIGTAIERYHDFQFNRMIYTVADEQDYHFQVLFLVLKKLGYTWAENCYHLSYGMVTLPSGKMKSREGTVVDADDLLDQMEQTAATIAKDRGKEKTGENLHTIVGMGALKFQLLKVDPRKSIRFDPDESIDFHGKTGPFIQYTYARIQSLLRKHSSETVFSTAPYLFNNQERVLIKKCLDYQSQLLTSSTNKSPALLANYLYDLVKTYNTYYQETPILQAKEPDTTQFRVALSAHIAKIIKKTTYLLGFEVPEKM